VGPPKVETVTRRVRSKAEERACRRASHRPRSSDRTRDGMALERHAHEQRTSSASWRCHRTANQNHVLSL